MLTIRRPLHAGDVGQGHGLAAAYRAAVAGAAQLVQEVQPAAGMSWIDEDRLAAVDDRSQRAGIVLVRDRGNHQHDEVGAADGLRHVGGREVDGNEPLMDAACLDAALRAQRSEPLGIAGVQAHGVTTPAQVGSRRAAAMAGAEDRNRFHRHFVTRARRPRMDGDHGQHAPVVNQSRTWEVVAASQGSTWLRVIRCKLGIVPDSELGTLAGVRADCYHSRRRRDHLGCIGRGWEVPSMTMSP